MAEDFRSAAAAVAVGKCVRQAQPQELKSVWKCVKISSEIFQDWLKLTANSWFAIFPVVERHQIYSKRPHLSDMRMHGHSCWAGNFALVERCSQPFSGSLTRVENSWTVPKFSCLSERKPKLPSASNAGPCVDWRQ